MLNLIITIKYKYLQPLIAQSAGYVEHIDFISADRWDPQRMSWYDIKQSDGQVLLMLDIWGMQGNPSLSSLPGSLWFGVVVPDSFLSLGQIELNSIPMLNWTAWNRKVLTLKL